MALDCPRCASTPLTERRVAPADGAAMIVHLCEACRGVWLDGHTLAALCPTLAHLPEHRDEVALLGRPGAGIARCLRCGTRPFEFDVIGVAIDFCLSCHGVWLDGDEYEESMLSAPGAPAEVRGGPYRQAARNLPKDPKCAYCGEIVNPKRSYMRELGLACARCHYQREQTAAELRAAETWTETPGFRLAGEPPKESYLLDLVSAAITRLTERQ